MESEKTFPQNPPPVSGIPVAAAKFHKPLFSLAKQMSPKLKARPTARPKLSRKLKTRRYY
jgi:hypothetical protein